VVFLSDLIRELPVSMTTETGLFLAVTSYGTSSESSGVCKDNQDLDISSNAIRT
jgi:hypoxanthine-guanine phosphoribosyltransferase